MIQLIVVVWVHRGRVVGVGLLRSLIILRSRVFWLLDGELIRACESVCASNFCLPIIIRGVAAELQSYAFLTVAAEQTSHATLTVAAEQPLHAVLTVAVEQTSHAFLTVVAEQPSHAVLTVAAEQLSHATLTVAAEQPLHAVLTVRKLLLNNHCSDNPHCPDFSTEWLKQSSRYFRVTYSEVEYWTQ